MGLSTAVGSERRSRIVGYKLTKGFNQNSTPNLPQRIAILGEATAAVNVAGLTTTPVQITSAKQAGDLFGYGSPIHQIMRILRPNGGVGIGGIPTVVYAQAEPGGAVAATRTITVTGTATANAVHRILINGRDNLDGQPYDITVVTGDTATDIAVKIKNAINAVLGAPCSAGNASGVVTATAKWKGSTSDQLTVAVNTDGVDAGVSYAIAAPVAGAGSVDISGALAQFGNTWNTIVINPYDASVHDTLEAFNGVPDPDTPTGRYAGIVFKPFIAIWGSTSSSVSTITTITDASARKDQVTNVLAPAPNSSGFTWEASANAALLFGRIMQDTPHLDLNGKSMPDMPVPEDELIGDFASYENRDLLVKAGASTVDITNGKYTFQDFVTTYHPDGEDPPQYRYARNLMIDFNIRYGYLLLEVINVVDHSVAENNQLVTVSKTIKPKQWIGILSSFADDLAKRNIIVEADFMKESLQVQTSETNPDRLETFYKYKRSPYVRIASTTAEAGFAFGLS